MSVVSATLVRVTENEDALSSQDLIVSINTANYILDQYGGSNIPPEVWLRLFMHTNLKFTFRCLQKELYLRILLYPVGFG